MTSTEEQAILDVTNSTHETKEPSKVSIKQPSTDESAPVDSFTSNSSTWGTYDSCQWQRRRRHSSTYSWFHKSFIWPRTNCRSVVAGTCQANKTSEPQDETDQQDTHKDVSLDSPENDNTVETTAESTTQETFENDTQSSEEIKGPLPPSVKIDIPANEPTIVAGNVSENHGSSSMLSSESVIVSSAASSISPNDEFVNDNDPVSPTRTGRRSHRSRSIALSLSSTTASGQPIVSSAVFIKKALTAIKNTKLHLKFLLWKAQFLRLSAFWWWFASSSCGCIWASSTCLLPD